MPPPTGARRRLTTPLQPSDLRPSEPESSRRAAISMSPATWNGRLRGSRAAPSSAEPPVHTPRPHPRPRAAAASASAAKRSTSRSSRHDSMSRTPVAPSRTPSTAVPSTSRPSHVRMSLARGAPHKSNFAWRIEAISNMASDFLHEIAALDSKELLHGDAGRQADISWDSLHLTARAHFISDTAPLLISPEEIISELAPGFLNDTDFDSLRDALERFTFATLVWIVFRPEKAAKMWQSGDKGKERQDSVRNTVRNRNSVLYTAWSKYWTIVPFHIEHEEAFSQWLNLATAIYTTYQCPELGELPDNTLPAPKPLTEMFQHPDFHGVFKRKWDRVLRAREAELASMDVAERCRFSELRFDVLSFFQRHVDHATDSLLSFIPSASPLPERRISPRLSRAIAEENDEGNRSNGRVKLGEEEELPVLNGGSERELFSLPRDRAVASEEVGESAVQTTLFAADHLRVGTQRPAGSQPTVEQPPQVGAQPSVAELQRLEEDQPPEQARLATKMRPSTDAPALTELTPLADKDTQPLAVSPSSEEDPPPRPARTPISEHGDNEMALGDVSERFDLAFFEDMIAEMEGEVDEDKRRAESHGEDYNESGDAELPPESQLKPASRRHGPLGSQFPQGLVPSNSQHAVKDQSIEEDQHPTGPESHRRAESPAKVLRHDSHLGAAATGDSEDTVISPLERLTVAAATTTTTALSQADRNDVDPVQSEQSQHASPTRSQIRDAIGGYTQATGTSPEDAIVVDDDDDSDYDEVDEILPSQARSPSSRSTGSNHGHTGARNQSLVPEEQENQQGDDALPSESMLQPPQRVLVAAETQEAEDSEVDADNVLPPESITHPHRPTVAVTTPTTVKELEALNADDESEEGDDALPPPSMLNPRGHAAVAAEKSKAERDVRDEDEDEHEHEHEHEDEDELPSESMLNPQRTSRTPDQVLVAYTAAQPNVQTVEEEDDENEDMLPPESMLKPRPQLNSSAALSDVPVTKDAEDDEDEEDEDMLPPESMLNPPRPSQGSSISTAGPANRTLEYSSHVVPPQQTFEKEDEPEGESATVHVGQGPAVSNPTGDIQLLVTPATSAVAIVSQTPTTPPVASQALAAPAAPHTPVLHNGSASTSKAPKWATVPAFWPRPRPSQSAETSLAARLSGVTAGTRGRLLRSKPSQLQQRQDPAATSMSPPLSSPAAPGNQAAFFAHARRQAQYGREFATQSPDPQPESVAKHLEPQGGSVDLQEPEPDQREPEGERLESEAPLTAGGSVPRTLRAQAAPAASPPSSVTNRLPTAPGYQLPSSSAPTAGLQQKSHNTLVAESLQPFDELEEEQETMGVHYEANESEEEQEMMGIHYEANGDLNHVDGNQKVAGEDNINEDQDSNDLLSAPIEEVDSPKIDLFMVDSGNRPLMTDPRLVLPRSYRKPRSVLFGTVNGSASQYVRKTGIRKWTWNESIFLYREIQKVPMSEPYPCRVIDYFYGEFAERQPYLQFASPQHMKDKMKSLVETRVNGGRPVVGRARHFLPKTDPRRRAYQRELNEAMKQDHTGAADELRVQATQEGEMERQREVVEQRQRQKDEQQRQKDEEKRQRDERKRQKEERKRQLLEELRALEEEEEDEEDEIADDDEEDEDDETHEDDEDEWRPSADSDRGGRFDSDDDDDNSPVRAINKSKGKAVDRGVNGVNGTARGVGRGDRNDNMPNRGNHLHSRRRDNPSPPPPSVPSRTFDIDFELAKLVHFPAELDPDYPATPPSSTPERSWSTSASPSPSPARKRKRQAADKRTRTKAKTKTPRRPRRSSLPPDEVTNRNYESDEEDELMSDDSLYLEKRKGAGTESVQDESRSPAVAPEDVSPAPALADDVKKEPEELAAPEVPEDAPDATSFLTSPLPSFSPAKRASQRTGTSTYLAPANALKTLVRRPLRPPTSPLMPPHAEPEAEPEPEWEALAPYRTGAAKRKTLEDAATTARAVKRKSWAVATPPQLSPEQTRSASRRTRSQAAMGKTTVAPTARAPVPISIGRMTRGRGHESRVWLKVESEEEGGGDAEGEERQEREDDEGAEDEEGWHEDEEGWHRDDEGHDDDDYADSDADRAASLAVRQELIRRRVLDGR